MSRLFGLRNHHAKISRQALDMIKRLLGAFERNSSMPTPLHGAT